MLLTVPLAAMVAGPATYGAGGGAPAGQRPMVCIPELPTAPAINGRISPGEVTGAWRFAARITGFPDYYLRTLPPARLDPTWWLAYGQKNLYLAAYLPAYPKGTIVARLTAAGKSRRGSEVGGMLRDDHVEIEIAVMSRRSGGSPLHFYKIMTNPHAVVVNQRLGRPVAGAQRVWRSGAMVRCRTTDNGWSMEMAIPLKNLQAEPISEPGSRWFIQLVSADGQLRYYAWRRVNYLQWTGFPEVVLDNKAPVFDLMSLGHVQHGQVDVQAKIKVLSGQVPVVMTVGITGASGRSLYLQHKMVLADGKFTTLRFVKKALLVGGHGEMLHLLATQGRKVIYQDTMRFDSLGATGLQRLYTSLRANRHGMGTLVSYVGHKVALTGQLLGGKIFSTKIWKNKVVIADFWASWCGPCRASMPALEQIYARYHGQGLEVLGISNDLTAGALRAYLKAHAAMRWPQMYTPYARANPLANRYGVSWVGIPVEFIIDRRGVVRRIIRNFDPVQEKREAAMVQRLLAEKRSN